MPTHNEISGEGKNMTNEKSKSGREKIAADRARGIEFSEDGKTLLMYSADLPDGTYEIPEGVTEIGHQAFSFCANLSEIHIPETVTSIGNMAFRFCANLSAVHIPDGVATIGDETFESCANLSEVYIPVSVTSIGESAFGGCESLKEVIIACDCKVADDAFPETCRVKRRSDVGRVPVNREKIATDQAKGIKFSKDGKTLLEYPYQLKDECYEIPEGVTVIGKGAFNSARVKHVVFPGSLKRIEAEGFMSAELQEAVLPEGLEEIGDAAFWCSGVNEVSLPRSLAKVGEFAFYGCISLRKLITLWDEPPCDTMEWRETISDTPSGEGEAPSSVFSMPRVFGNCPRVTDVTGCESLKKLVREYQRRSANPLPEDNPDNWRDYEGS